ncbi:MAG TPA: hypothetical protein EYP10_02380 [Armatimonadetes bacterium]|nr:hypothetical protein [Armatimonadota bacterium]
MHLSRTLKPCMSLLIAWLVAVFSAHGWCERISFTVTETMTLKGAFQIIANRTGQPIYVASADMDIVNRYRFPPHLIGVHVVGDSAGEVLSFLFGRGWEGSPIAEAMRERAGEQYQLARTPPCITLGRIRSWTCNNRYFDWEPHKRGVRVTVRLNRDGDLVNRKPFSLDVRDEYVFDTLRELIKQRTGIYINVAVEEHRFVPSNLLPEYKDARFKEPILMPMRCAQLSHLFGNLLDQPHTLGEWLSILAEGLNLHSRPRGCMWKWSATRVKGREKPIYTLRCYAHPPMGE